MTNMGKKYRFGATTQFKMTKCELCFEKEKTYRDNVQLFWKSQAQRLKDNVMTCTTIGKNAVLEPKFYINVPGGNFCWWKKSYYADLSFSCNFEVQRSRSQFKRWKIKTPVVKELSKYTGKTSTCTSWPPSPYLMNTATQNSVGQRQMQIK